MIYHVIYNRNSKRYEMFDIECYPTSFNEKSKEYICELDTVIIPIGYNYFLEDNISKDDFDIEEFTKDATELNELRGLLYELDNHPRSIDEIKIFYNEFEKTINHIIKRFVNKYNLILELD